MAELSQKELEELVVGKPQKPRVLFFEKAALNVAKSKEAGKRIYETKVYVQPMQTGVRDSIAYLAQKSDVREYRAEYEEFLKTRQGSKQSASISIIPNLELAHMQELVDMGLGTIDALAESQVVPAHLEYARQSAKALSAVLKEQRHGKEESEQEIEQHGTGVERHETEEVRRDHPLPPLGGQEHVRREQRPEPAASGRDGDDEDPRRVRQTGQQHHRQDLNDWTVNFTLG
jgi:hypothetical protein